MTIDTPEEFMELKRECIRQVKFYVELAEKKIGVRIPMPRVTFDLKGMVAGRAHYRANLIQFSPTLLRENAEKFLVSTTGHEVAHLIARIQKPNIKPHGAEWRRVMWAFSLPATRCHSYDTSVVPTQLGKQRNPNRRGPIEIKIEGGLIARPNAVGRCIEFD